MVTTGKGKLVETLYGPYDDHSKAPNGLLLPRCYPINSKYSERATSYQGSDFNEWTTIPKGFCEVVKLTPTNFQREGDREVILMNPCEPSPPNLNLETLGYRANIDSITVT